MKKILFTISFFLLSLCSYSQIPDSLLEEKTAKLYHFIKDWWQTPYSYGGTTKRGVDCSAFTQKLYTSVYDIKLPRTASTQYKLGKEIKREDLEVGDLVFFTSRGPSGWHVGVYLIDGWFVHSGSSGVYINNLSEPKYAERIRGYKRVIPANGYIY